MRIEVVTPTRGRPERWLEAIASLQDPSHEDWRAYAVDDGDPRLDPDPMREVMRHLATGPKRVHRGGWLVFEENGRELDREPFRLPADATSARHDDTVLTSGLAWPRALHDRLGVFDPSVGSDHDWDWILRVVGAGVPLVEIPGPGVGYRIHGGNASAARSAKPYDRSAEPIHDAAYDARGGRRWGRTGTWAFGWPRTAIASAGSARCSASCRSPSRWPRRTATDGSS